VNSVLSNISSKDPLGGITDIKSLNGTHGAKHSSLYTSRNNEYNNVFVRARVRVWETGPNA